MKWVVGIAVLIVLAIAFTWNTAPPTTVAAAPPCGAAFEVQASTGGRVKAAEAAKTVCGQAAEDAMRDAVKRRYG